MINPITPDELTLASAAVIYLTEYWHVLGFKLIATVILFTELL